MLDKIRHLEPLKSWSNARASGQVGKTFLVWNADMSCSGVPVLAFNCKQGSTRIEVYCPKP
jgi:hypothetical protein